MDDRTQSLYNEALQKFQKKQFKEAAAGFQECVAALENTGAALDLAEMKNNLGVALIYAGDPQAGLDAVQGTEAIFAEAGDPKRQGMALANQGNALEALKQYDQAIEFYEKARDCFIACGEKKMLSVTLRSLADLQMKTGRKFQAVASLQDAYEQNPDAKLKSKFFSKTLKQLLNKMTGK